MDFMPFGKYKNKLISEIPTSYIQWGIENLTAGGVHRQFVEELSKRKGEKPHGKKPVIQGTYVSNAYQPNKVYEDIQVWDGTTAPWLDQKIVG